MMASGLAFMKIANVDGEEPYGSGLKLIRIAGFKHNLAVPMSTSRLSVGAQSTMRRTYCEHADFTVFKGLDITSGKIFDLCSRAAVVPEVAIYMCRSDISTSALSSGDFTPQPFLSIVMSNVVVANFSYELKMGWPAEEIALRYTSVSWILDWVNPETGSAANLGGVGWNGQTNAPTPPYASSTSIPSSVKFSTSQF